MKCCKGMYEQRITLLNDSESRAMTDESSVMGLEEQAQVVSILSKYQAHHGILV